MLNVVAALFIVFGLIGIFALVLRYLHQSGRLSAPFLGGQPQGVIVEPPIQIDGKRKIVSIAYRGQRYVLLLGPHNDVLLESSSAVRQVENPKFENSKFESSKFENMPLDRHNV